MIPDRRTSQQEDKPWLHQNTNKPVCVRPFGRVRSWPGQARFCRRALPHWRSAHCRAVALGAVALGRLAIGRLDLGRGRIRTLTIDELTVGRLRVGKLIMADEADPDD
ncbi:MAG TPA: hypothetical protein VFX76_11920 [Roseiflexaceae bacterium]|nr:hypothetical protein [Roseiflexaceae bacterium]